MFNLNVALSFRCFYISTSSVLHLKIVGEGGVQTGTVDYVKSLFSEKLFMNESSFFVISIPPRMRC